MSIEIPKALPDFQQKLGAFLLRMETLAQEAKVGVPRFLLSPGERGEDPPTTYTAAVYLFTFRWQFSLRPHGERMVARVALTRPFDAEEVWMPVDAAPLEVQLLVAMRAVHILKAFDAHVARVREHMAKALTILQQAGGQSEPTPPSW